MSIYCSLVLTNGDSLSLKEYSNQNLQSCCIPKVTIAVKLKTWINHPEAFWFCCFEDIYENYESINILRITIKALSTHNFRNSILLWMIRDGIYDMVLLLKSLKAVRLLCKVHYNLCDVMLTSMWDFHMPQMCRLNQG